MKLLMGAALTAFAVPALAVTDVTRSVEAAGVSETARGGVTGIERFDGRTTLSFSTEILPGLTAIFASLPEQAPRPANLHGGADDSEFVQLLRGQQLSVSFSRPVEYLGLWVSALSNGNELTLFRGDEQLVRYRNSGILPSGLGPDYFGNPFDIVGGSRANPGELYAFLNLNIDGGFDRVVFRQRGGGGFEIDNLTVGAVVPEPAAWALMIAGFGMVGVATRRRRAPQRVTA